MKKRLLKMIAAQQEDPGFEPNDLAANPTALETVPGVLAALVLQVRATIEEIRTAELVDEVDAWLASGDD